METIDVHVLWDVDAQVFIEHRADECESQDCVFDVIHVTKRQYSRWTAANKAYGTAQDEMERTWQERTR